MNQICIVYSTKTKYFQNLIEAIGKIPNIKAENVKIIVTPRVADLMFIIGGIYVGKSAPEFLRHVEGLNARQSQANAENIGQIVKHAKKIAAGHVYRVLIILYCHI